MQGCVISTVMLVAAALCVSEASAAVRNCRAGVASEITAAGSELEGKRKALISWTARAAKLGPGYTSWRIADRKVLGCTKAKAPATGYQCIAFALPCTVEQLPGKPRRRIFPAGRGPAIEV